MPAAIAAQPAGARVVSVTNVLLEANQVLAKPST